MALAKYGGGVVQMVGALGGDVHQRSRSGRVIRSNRKNRDARTTAQLEHRGRVSRVNTAWNERLTSAQRAAWNKYADQVEMQNVLGDSIHLTGYNHFCRYSYASMQHINTLGITAPTEFKLPPQCGGMLLTIPNLYQIYFRITDRSPWAQQGGNQLFVYMHAPVKDEFSYISKDFSFQTRIATPIGTNYYTLSFPDGLESGKYYRMGFRGVLSDGRLTEMWYAGDYAP